MKKTQNKTTDIIEPVEETTSMTVGSTPTTALSPSDKKGHMIFDEMDFFLREYGDWEILAEEGHPESYDDITGKRKITLIKHSHLKDYVSDLIGKIKEYSDIYLEIHKRR